MIRVLLRYLIVTALITGLFSCASAIRYSSKQGQTSSEQTDTKQQEVGFTQTGYASYYADKFEGKATASGEIFSQKKLTAAHKTLSFGTKLKVTNLQNGKTVLVTVNDRGPFVEDRIIDLSKAAAEQLGMLGNGVIKVRIETINK